MPILLQVFKKNREWSAVPEDITQAGGAGRTLQFDARSHGNLQQRSGWSSERAARMLFKFDGPYCFKKLDADRLAGLAHVHLLSPQGCFITGQPQELSERGHRHGVPVFQVR